MRKFYMKLGILAVAAIAFMAVAPSSASAMNKAELIDAMASESGLSKADSKRALEGFVSATTKALKKGDRVALVGFGSFSVSKGVQNSSGKGSTVLIEAGRAVDFRSGDRPYRPNESVVDTRELARLMAGEMCTAGKSKLDADRSSAGPDDDCDGRGDDRLTAEALRALDGFVSATTKALTAGDTVSIEGFGDFYVPGAAARTGRNPQTGKEIKIAAKNVVKFKAGAELSGKVN